MSAIIQKDGPCRVSKERFDAINKDKYKRELGLDEMNDYLSYMFYESFGYNPDFNNPQTYNEKLNWLKLYYQKPKMHAIADKAKFPLYVMTKLPAYKEHCIRPLTIFHSSSEFTNDVLDKLPERFVLKSNFGSGAQLFVNKDVASIGKIKSHMRAWLKAATNHYFCALEYGYKDIEPAVICEPIIDFEYKMEFYCFDGEPFFYWVVKNDKTKEVQANLYYVNGEKIPISWHYPNFEEEMLQPPFFDELVDVSRKLSKSFPHVRVDFYVAKDTWYFSEMTFYTWAGLMPFSDFAYDIMFGEKLDLSKLEGACA